MVSSDNTEADDVPLIVQDLQAFRAAGSGQPGDDADFSKGADIAVPEDHVAALDEVFVGLWVVEAAND